MEDRHQEEIAMILITIITETEITEEIAMKTDTTRTDTETTTRKEKEAFVITHLETKEKHFKNVEAFFQEK